jgi:hypothetical protein
MSGVPAWFDTLWAEQFAGKQKIELALHVDGNGSPSLLIAVDGLDGGSQKLGHLLLGFFNRWRILLNVFGFHGFPFSVCGALIRLQPVLSHQRGTPWCDRFRYAQTHGYHKPDEMPAPKLQTVNVGKLILMPQRGMIVNVFNRHSPPGSAQATSCLISMPNFFIRFHTVTRLTPSIWRPWIGCRRPPAAPQSAVPGP